MFNISKVSLHMWEEPPISGERGSGTIFFAGCTLRCKFCQNYEISRTKQGITVPASTLCDLMLYLQTQGAHNINLVSPSLYSFALPEAIKAARSKGLVLPIVYNTHAYETVASIKKLDGLIDIYLPDFKYSDNIMAQSYSNAKNYYSVAKAAISEMRRQRREDKFDTDGIMQSGVIVRHLVLPCGTDNAAGVFRAIAEIDRGIYVSVMSQYFPTENVMALPELSRRLTEKEYDEAIDSFFKAGLSKGFMQEAKSAIKEYVPDFDLSQLKAIIEAL